MKNFKKLFSIVLVSLFIVADFLVVPNLAFAATITSNASGNWSAASTWAAVSRTGTIAYTNGSAAVTGTDTSFTTELAVGSIIITTGSGAITRTVASIIDNTHLTLTTNANSTKSGKIFTAQIVPSLNDAVVIGNGNVITVDSTSSCASLAFPSGNSSDSTVNINSGVTLNVSGGVTIPRANSNKMNTLAVGSGNLNAGSISFTDAGTTVRHQLTISTGTVIVSGNVTQDGTGVSPSVSFTGAGLLKLGGTFLSAGTLTPGTGTVEYNKAGTQTVGYFSYNNLILSGTSAKTMPAGTSISGNLSIASAGSATASVAASQNLNVGTLTVGGLGTINGTWGSTSSSATNKNNTYFAATTGRLTVATDTRSAQTITFGSLSDKTYGDADFDVSATATSGLTVTFTASGNCSVSTNTVHMTGAGSCTITAHQAGNGNYSAASDVPQSFTINASDTEAPTVAGITSEGQKYNSSTSSPQTIKITFSEDIVNVPAVEVHTVVTGESVNNCSDSDAKTFCFDYAINPSQQTTHTIYISEAQDAAGNTMTTDSSHTFIVDTVAPTLNLPEDITEEATSSSGAAVIFSATATDWNPASFTALCNPASGETFPLGTGSVACSATDDAGNISTGSFNVTVQDTTKPTIALKGSNPMDVQVNTSYTEPDATVTDNYDTGLTATIDSSAVNISAVGSYTVYYNATDSHSNAATQVTRTVNVVDTEAPSTSDNVPAGWQTSATTVTFSCTDNSGSCARVYYTTDGNDPTGDSSYVDSSNSWQFTMSTEGQYTIKYLGVDDSGNYGSVKTATNTLQIDINAPSVPNLSSPEDGYETNPDPTLAWGTSSDSISGLKEYLVGLFYNLTDSNPYFSKSTGTDTTYNTNDASITNGIYYWGAKAKDNAGNESAWSGLWKFIKDTVNPFIDSITSPL